VFQNKYRVLEHFFFELVNVEEKMDPNGFWGTLDMFVGHENKRTGKDVLGDVGNWLNTFPEKGTDANYRLR
jgi:hypothetical protein